MKRLLLILAAVLAIPAVSSACEQVVVGQLVAPVYSQQLVAPVVYQAQVQAVQVQAVAYAAPVELAVVANHCNRQQVRVRRHPIRNTLRLVTPPFRQCH